MARSYLVWTADTKTEIQCQWPGDAWNSSSNLVTATKYYTTGYPTDLIASIHLPDGTFELHEFSTNSTQRTTSISRGQPNGGGTAVIDGTKTITVVGTAGQMVSNIVQDIATGIILAQSTYSNYDPQLRPQRVTFLDGTYSDTVYGCCGIDSQSERDGTTTTFTYDALKRKTSETRLGITTWSGYDAAGNLVSVQRQPTTGPTITLKTLGYDLAGQLIAETDGVGVVTTYAYGVDGSGQTVKTVTYAFGTADQATRVETYGKDGSLVKVTGTAVNPVRYVYGVEQDGGSGPYLRYKQEIKLDAGGNDTSEWVKTYTDTVGRAYKTVYAANSGTPNNQSSFNTLGQLSKQVDPDGVITLFAYNLKGELQDSVLDTNRNSVIDLGGLDRVTRTIQDVLYNSTYGYNVQRTRTFVFPNNNDGTTTIETSRLERSTDGSRTWTTSFGLVTSSQTVYNAGAGTRTDTVTAPDGSYVIKVYTNGRLVSTTQYAYGGAQLGQTTYAYDPHGRVAAQTDARNGTTSYTYDNADRVLSVTTPPPGTGQAAQTTTSYYDNMGRVWQIVNPDGTSVANQYYTSGLLYQTSGSRSYPVRYTYDPQGRVKTMTTWTSFSSGTGAAVTTWNYDGHRGFLISKLDANGYGPSYQFSPAGRLTSTTWARSGQSIGISYDNLGQVVLRSYPGTGPANVSYGYDRRGRLTMVTQGGGTRTIFYNDAGQQLGTSYAGGTLSGLSLTNTYDTLLRRTYLGLVNSGGTTLDSTSYGYDNASRILSVNNPYGYTTNIYLANSSLLGETDYYGPALRYKQIRQYDCLNRLIGNEMHVMLPPRNSLLSQSFAYQYNDANQRTRMTREDGSFWIYQYDALGQVTSGKRYWNDGTPVAGEQFEYGYNDIGNRTSTKAGGDAGGGALRFAGYTPTSLNQYASRTVPGGFDVLGLGDYAAAVTVNSQSTYRRSEFFQSLVTVNNGAGPVYQSVTATAVKGTNSTSKTGNVFVPQTPEGYGYDLDGNTLSDGRWSYTWDAENRLVGMQSLVNGPSTSQRKLVFEYDDQGRRIRKTVYDGTSGSWVLSSDSKYVYDGWDLIAELDANNALVRFYSWGVDLSGRMDGAGGIGGLALVYTPGFSAGCPFYDGNGNVAGIYTMSYSTCFYEYGPFGEVIRATSSITPAIPIRCPPNTPTWRRIWCITGIATTIRAREGGCRGTLPREITAAICTALLPIIPSAK